MPQADAQPDDAPEDGRRARRDRNRYAVVDAFLELVREGNPRPSVADVAERSGVSHRSVFRYFADRDELTRTAIERQQAFARPLLRLTVGPGAPLDERIEQFVARRLELYEALAPVARLSRSLAYVQPIVAEQLAANRQYYRGQVEHLFAADLEPLPAEQRASRLAALDVLCSFDAIELLRHDHGLDVAATAVVLGDAIRSLLTTNNLLSH